MCINTGRARGGRCQILQLFWGENSVSSVFYDDNALSTNVSYGMTAPSNVNSEHITSAPSEYVFASLVFNE